MTSTLVFILISNNDPTVEEELDNNGYDLNTYFNMAQIEGYFEDYGQIGILVKTQVAEKIDEQVDKQKIDASILSTTLKKTIHKRI